MAGQQYTFCKIGLYRIQIIQIDQKGATRLNFNITGAADLTYFLNYKKFKIPYRISDYNKNIVISKENKEASKITAEEERLSLNL